MIHVHWMVHCNTLYDTCTLNGTLCDTLNDTLYDTCTLNGTEKW